MKFRLKKAQFQMSNLTLVGLLIPFFILFLYFSFSAVQDHFQLLKVEDIVSSLQTTADTVNTLGTGNKESVYLTIPKGITGSVVKGNVISVSYEQKKKNLDFIKKTRSTLIGGFSVADGNYRVPVKAINATLVRIGEGMLLHSISPNCVSTSQLPGIITLNGDEFTPTTELLVNGQPYVLPFFVTFIDPTKIEFLAATGAFPPHSLWGAYNLSLRDGTIVSNVLPFYVYPSSSTCGTQEHFLDFAHLYDGTTHQFLENITTIVAQDDGYKVRVTPAQEIHIQFQSTLKRNDFIRTTVFCTQNGTLSVLEDGTSTVLGSSSCNGGEWQSYKIFLDQLTGTKKIFDIEATVAADYDYISAWKV